MDQRRRWLFLSVDPAVPAISGADLRTSQNAAAVGRHYEVVLASLGKPTHDGSNGTQHVPGVSSAEVWASDFSPQFPTNFIGNLTALCDRLRPDVVVLETLALAGLAPAIRPLTKAIVLDLHNVESSLAEEDVRYANGDEEANAFSSRVRRLRSIEQDAIANVDAVWVCSSEDRHRVRELGGSLSKIWIVPNTVPRPETIPAILPAKMSVAPKLLFLGHLGYAPNIEAASLLIGMMPAVVERLPNATLTIAGRSPHRTILARVNPHVRVVANPDSVQALLQNADIAVLPLRRGGGTRIKALEAMAWGLPLVATGKSVEGLGLRDGIHVTLAETPDSFITAIFDLSTDAARYNSFRSMARDFVIGQFGERALENAVESAMTFLER